MAYNPQIHHRQSIRLKGYDYSQAGAYFITLCTQNREHLFGEVKRGEMVLSLFGEIAYQEWLKTPEVRPQIALDVFVVMPNHLHGILLITSLGTGVGSSKGELHSPHELHTPPSESAPISQSEPANEGVCDAPRRMKSPSNTVGAVIRGYKAAVTKKINLIKPGTQVWQRNYYEHIIRDERGYHNISQYISNNPLQWEADMFYRA